MEDPMSTSAARIAANKANAQKSTVPRTEAGKARVSTNALKHGLRSDRNPLSERLSQGDEVRFAGKSVTLATDTALPFEREEFETPSLPSRPTSHPKAPSKPASSSASPKSTSAYNEPSASKPPTSKTNSSKPSPTPPKPAAPSPPTPAAPATTGCSCSPSSATPLH